MGPHNIIKTPDLSASQLTLTAAERLAFGKLLKFVTAQGVRDVLAQHTGKRAIVFVDVEGGLKEVPELDISAAELREIAVELIAAGGRHVDELEPLTDVQLGSGIRVHVVLPPIVKHGATISIRVPGQNRLSLMRLFQNGLCDTQTAKTLLKAVFERQNILVSGATGSGKTTLLSALLSEAKKDERIVTIEDVAEINLAHPHHVSLQSRQANTEGIGEVSLERLLKESLRMRPDRLVLGECRGAEVATLLTALNTGHDGGASTIHANGVNDVPARLEALGALANMTPGALARQAVSAIDLVVHVERNAGQHRVSDLATLGLNQTGRLVANSLDLENPGFAGIKNYQGIFEVA